MAKKLGSSHIPQKFSSTEQKNFPQRREINRVWHVVASAPNKIRKNEFSNLTSRNSKLPRKDKKKEMQQKIFRKSDYSSNQSDTDLRLEEDQHTCMYVCDCSDWLSAYYHCYSLQIRGHLIIHMKQPILSSTHSAPSNKETV